MAACAPYTDHADLQFSRCLISLHHGHYHVLMLHSPLHCDHYSPPQACDRVPVGAGRSGHQHTLRPGAEREATLLQQDTGGGGGDLAPAQTHPPAIQLQLRPRLCASVSFVLCFDEKYISCAYMFNDHFIIRENVG